MIIPSWRTLFMKKFLTLTAIVATGLLVSSAQASWLYDWAGDPSGTVLTLSDASGEVAEDSRDIENIWYANDGSNHYFRMDLRGAPLQAANEHAPEYAIQIDSGAGGGSAVNTNYIADGLIGIDSILIGHYTTSGAHTVQHRHNYQGDASPLPRVDTVMLAAIGGSFDADENGGTTLQWAIPVTELGSLPFTIYGATQDIDDADTFDTTVGLNVPEPAMLLTLGLGTFALRIRRRS